VKRTTLPGSRRGATRAPPTLSATSP